MPIASMPGPNRAAPLTPGAGLRELRNKLEAFGWFQTSMDVLGAGERMPLAALTARAAAFGPYRSAWLLEAAGYCYSRVHNRTGSARGMLSSLAAQRIPAGWWAAMHAGMGMQLAERILVAGLPARADLFAFIDACRANSAPGCFWAAFEPLGLVARTLAPESIGMFDEWLAAHARHLRPYFWHGVGRGAYFAPSRFLPFGTVRARMIEESMREAPTPLLRANSLAGTAWATLLVNVRHPEVLENVVHDCRGVARGTSFSSGVASAASLWCRLQPDCPYLPALLRHRPGTALAADWHQLVAGPVRDGVRTQLDCATLFCYPLERAA